MLLLLLLMLMLLMLLVLLMLLLLLLMLLLLMLFISYFMIKYYIGLVTTLAGSLNKTYTDGQGTEAQFSNPYTLSIASTGQIYVVDAGHQRIRTISTTDGTVSTYLGHGSSEYNDGAGTYADLNYPYGVAIDTSTGNMFFDSTGYGIIRRVSSSGIVTSLAGSELQNYQPTYTDGLGTDASFYGPREIVIDTVGNLFVADIATHTVRKLSLANGMSRQTKLINKQPNP